MSDRYTSSDNTSNPYTVWAAAATSVTVAKVIHDVTGHNPGPLTGYQYTQSGSKNMDDTMVLLRQKKDNGEYVMKARDRADLLSDHTDLQPEMARLRVETRTYGGSLRNLRTAREFYNNTVDLEHTTKTSSDKALAEYERAKAMEELGQILTSEELRAESRQLERGSQSRKSSHSSKNERSIEFQSHSEHPWEDGRSSLSCGSGGQNYGSTSHFHRDHRQYPQGAQSPRHMHGQPMGSRYPQEGSSSDYSAYYAVASTSSGYHPVNEYPPVSLRK